MLRSSAVPYALCGAAALATLYVVSRRPLATPTPTGRLPSPPPSPLSRASDDPTKPTLTILFGSQTGTAEGFANTLGAEGKTLGFRTAVVDLLDYEPEQLSKERCVIFVVATYGEGEPTDSARDFYDWLGKQSQETCDLSQTKFAIFGLGDTQYKHFNQCGKDTQRLLLLCGAKEAHRRGEGDADKQLEDDFEDWKGDLWPAVTALYGLPYIPQENYDVERTTMLTVIETAGQVFPYTKRLELNQKNPAWAPVLTNRELLQDTKGERSTRHVELDITGMDLRYEAGDHAGVFGQNPAEVVDDYLGVLDNPHPPDAVFVLKPKKRGAAYHPLPSPCTLRQALEWYVDLTYPAKKSVLKALSHFAPDDDTRARLRQVLGNTPEAKAAFKQLSEQLRNTAAWLRHFRTTVPVDAFLEHMPRLQPRFYSIASDYRLHPTAIHLCVAVEPGGVCTPFLQQRKVADVAPLFVRRSTFHYPRAANTPLILIGPGTGVAPLIGLLQRREALAKQGEALGPCHLFFGCRRRDEDFLYEPELQRWKEMGLLTSLHLAFSREGPTKVYVQHLLAQEGELVTDCLDNGGRVYVCGDAREMARDVEATLKELLLAKGGAQWGTPRDVENYLTMLEKKDRYLKDVWTTGAP